MSAVGDARQGLAVKLAAVGVPIHTYPPGSLTAPCVVLKARGEWIGRHTSQLWVAAYTNPAAGNAEAIQRMEDLVEAIRQTMSTYAVSFGVTDEYRVDLDTGLLMAETPVTVRTTCV